MLINVKLTDGSALKFLSNPQKIETGIYHCPSSFNYILDDTGYKIAFFLFSHIEKADKIREEIEYFNGKNYYGMADNINQIKKYYKKQIADRNRRFVISIYERGVTEEELSHLIERGKEGKYLGKRKGKKRTFNNQLINFRLIEILQSPSIFRHCKNILHYPFKWIRYQYRKYKLNKKLDRQYKKTKTYKELL